MSTTPGDNREVTIVTSESVDVTFNITNADGYTSSNDTATNKYFDYTIGTADKIQIRSSVLCHIKAINGINLTDPITIATNGSYTETGCKKEYGGIANITMTFTSDTQVKIRAISQTS